MAGNRALGIVKLAFEVGPGEVQRMVHNVRQATGREVRSLVLQPRFGRSARQEVPGMTDVNEAEGWAKGLDELAGRLAPRFGRVEPRRRLLAYLRGLLAPLGRKNGWQLAEAAGDRTPDGMQDFLSRMRWD